eukprot:1259552-Pyramimonas_sp.AAC.1
MHPIAFQDCPQDCPKCLSSPPKKAFKRQTSFEPRVFLNVFCIPDGPRGPQQKPRRTSRPPQERPRPPQERPKRVI